MPDHARTRQSPSCSAAGALCWPAWRDTRRCRSEHGPGRYWRSRTYDHQALPTLPFIRQAQTLGLSLKEIKLILDLQRQGQQQCDRVIGMLDKHLDQIDRRIAV